jgi:hypothetical protein
MGANWNWGGGGGAAAGVAPCPLAGHVGGVAHAAPPPQHGLGEAADEWGPKRGQAQDALSSSETGTPPPERLLAQGRGEGALPRLQSKRHSFTDTILPCSLGGRETVCVGTVP